MTGILLLLLTAFAIALLMFGLLSANDRKVPVGYTACPRCGCWVEVAKLLVMRLDEHNVTYGECPQCKIRFSAAYKFLLAACFLCLVACNSRSATGYIVPANP